jgi:hypothetical protein
MVCFGYKNFEYPILWSNASLSRIAALFVSREWLRFGLPLFFQNTVIISFDSSFIAVPISVILTSSLIL